MKEYSFHWIRGSGEYWILSRRKVLGGFRSKSRIGRTTLIKKLMARPIITPETGSKRAGLRLITEMAQIPRRQFALIIYFSVNHPSSLLCLKTKLRLFAISLSDRYFHSAWHVFYRLITKSGPLIVWLSWCFNWFYAPGQWVPCSCISSYITELKLTNPYTY